MIQVMKFGVIKIVSGAEVLRDQSHKAHKYYNALIELEREHRTKYRAIRAAVAPELVACEEEMAKVTEEIDDIYDEIKLTRQALSKPAHPGAAPTPTKTPASPEQDARLKVLRARRKELAASAKVLREEFSQMLEPADEEFDIRTSGITRKHARDIKKAANDLNKLKKKDPETRALRKEIKANLDYLRAKKKEISPSTWKKGEANRKVLSEMLEENWPQVWKDIASLSEQKNVQQKALRAACELGSGTYAGVEAAVKQAVQEAEGDPEFRRWEAGRAARKVGRQITGTFLASEFLSTVKGPLRAECLGRHRPESKGNRARSFRYLVTLDLGKGLGPILMECVFHRPIPGDSRIRWVYLVPELKPDGKWKWSLQLTLELSKPLIERAPGPKGSGTLHVDFRWSLTPDRGLTVALLKAPGKAPETLVLSPKLVDRFEFSRRVQGFADKHFDEARNALIEWMAKHPDSVPEWLKEETVHIARWRSRRKLARLVEQWITDSQAEHVCHTLWQDWKTDRLSKDLDLFCSLGDACEWLSQRSHPTTEVHFLVWLDWWRRKNRHLEAMANGTRARAIRARKDFFRQTAARLCTQYERVEFGPLEIARSAKRKTPDRDKDELHQTARRQRTWAAPGGLKEALVATFGSARSSDEKKPEGARKEEKQEEGVPETA